jgi:hypothetical protein
MFGGGAAGTFLSTPQGSQIGNNGTAYGGGGSGGVRTNFSSNPGTTAGGSGATGVVIVEEFY